MAKKTRKRFDTGGYMAHGGKVELIFHGSSREIPMGEFDSAADAKRYVESSDWQRPYSIKKINKTPKVVRTQFEEEVFEYADGGEVGDEVIIELNNGKKIQGKIERLSPLKIRTSSKETIVVPNSLLKSVKKMAKGGETKPSLIPDYKKISNVEVEDIDRDDYPDFSDAYISYAEYDGEPMTDEQLEELNQDGLFVYDAIHMRLFEKGGEVDYSYLKDEIERTAMRVRKGLISIGEGERKLERMESGLKSDLKEANKDKSARELEIMYNQICSKYELDFDVIEDEYDDDDDYADGGKVRQNKKDKLWESIKNKFSEIFYLKETDSNEIFSNDVTAEKNEYLYFASAWVTTTLSFEEAENKFKRMLTEDEKKIIKIERNVKDINEAFGVMSEKKILVKRIDKMAKGGKVKSRWIQDALTGNKGALRKTAKRKGLIKGDEKLSKSDLNKLEKMGGKTARRARLAETLIDFKK